MCTGCDGDGVENRYSADASVRISAYDANMVALIHSVEGG